MKPRSRPEVTGEVAQARRDGLERYLNFHGASATVTWITGLAPSQPTDGLRSVGSVTRAAAVAASLAILGAAGILCGQAVLMVAGSVCLISAMRNFVSGVGHHLTHTPDALPIGQETVRLWYDIIGALFLTLTFQQYRKVHQKHHAFAGGSLDPDQQFIQDVGVTLRSCWGFVKSLLDLRVHVAFLTNRLISVLADGPGWRRWFAGAVLLAAGTLPFPVTVVWFGTITVGYQLATLTSWSTLHRWGRRPPQGTSFEKATAVTVGRLLIPEARLTGLLRLPVYALVRLLWLQADLQNHDLHHIGEGPWVDAAHVRSRLIREGVPLRQTVSLREMFRGALQSAAGIDDDELLCL